MENRIKYDFTIEEIHWLNELKEPDKRSTGTKINKCTFCKQSLGKKYCRFTVRKHYTDCPEVQQYVAKGWTAAKAEKYNAIRNDENKLYIIG